MPLAACRMTLPLILMPDGIPLPRPSAPRVLNEADGPELVSPSSDVVTVQLCAWRITDLDADPRIIPSGDPVVLNEGVRSSQNDEDSLTVSNQVVGVHPVSRT